MVGVWGVVGVVLVAVAVVVVVAVVGVGLAGLLGVSGSGVGVGLRGVEGTFEEFLAVSAVGVFLRASSPLAAVVLLPPFIDAVDVAAFPTLLSFFTGSKVKPVEVKPVEVVLNIGVDVEAALDGDDLNGFSSSLAGKPTTSSLSGEAILKPATPLTTACGVDSCEGGSGCFIGVRLAASLSILLGVVGWSGIS